MTRDISRGVLAVLFGAMFLFLLLAACGRPNPREAPVVGQVIGRVPLNSLDDALVVDLPDEGRRCLIGGGYGTACWEVAPR